jgi:hypothetical protein
LLAVGGDGGVRVVHTGIAAWRQAACSIVGRSLTRTEWVELVGENQPYRLTCGP